MSERELKRLLRDGTDCECCAIENELGASVVVSSPACELVCLRPCG